MQAVIQLFVLLGCIVVGSRIGGIGLGTVAGVGMVVLVFGFGVLPGKVPVDVLLIILSVITAVSAMQAAGGLSVLVDAATRVMKKRPRAITFVAPLVAYTLTVLCGTEHITYSLLPVIAEVARKAGIRPERPLSIAVVAAQQGVTASPVSAVTATMLTLLAGSTHLTLVDMMKVIIPSSLVGIAAGALSVAWRGDEISAHDDAHAVEAAQNALSAADVRRARLAIMLFLLGVFCVVLLGAVPSLRPIDTRLAESKPLPMAACIEMTMLVASTLIMLLTRTKPEAVVSSTVMRSGMVALISIFGIAWLGSTYFEGNQTAIVGNISDLIRTHIWIFALGLFVLSIFLYSQAATVAALMPLGFQLGIAPPLLIAMVPAVNGFFFFPTYGTLVAAINFDTTGSTRVGKLILNHSFMRPELVASSVAVATGLLLAQWLF